MPEETIFFLFLLVTFGAGKICGAYLGWFVCWPFEGPAHQLAQHNTGMLPYFGNVEQPK